VSSSATIGRTDDLRLFRSSTARFESEPGRGTASELHASREAPFRAPAHPRTGRKQRL